MLFYLCLGLSHEQNMAKMRLLTFMGMAVETKEISFDTMQQELQIGADDVEPFVIDGRAQFPTPLEISGRLGRDHKLRLEP